MTAFQCIKIIIIIGFVSVNLIILTHWASIGYIIIIIIIIIIIYIYILYVSFKMKESWKKFRFL